MVKKEQFGGVVSEINDANLDASIVVNGKMMDVCIAKELRANLDAAIQYTENQLDRITREGFEGK